MIKILLCICAVSYLCPGWAEESDRESNGLARTPSHASCSNDDSDKLLPKQQPQRSPKCSRIPISIIRPLKEAQEKSAQKPKRAKTNRFYDLYPSDRVLLNPSSTSVRHFTKRTFSQQRSLGQDLVPLEERASSHRKMFLDLLNRPTLVLALPPAQSIRTFPDLLARETLVPSKTHRPESIRTFRPQASSQTARISAKRTFPLLRNCPPPPEFTSLKRGNLLQQLGKAKLCIK